MLRAEIFYSNEPKDIVVVDARGGKKDLIKQLKEDKDYIQLKSFISDTIFTFPHKQYVIAWTEIDDEVVKKAQEEKASIDE